MNTKALPFRQVHLDFHTSEQITQIGAAFDPETFSATLGQARVNSVTCFARCHHGWMYYDTTAFAERRHPHLTRNLLCEQIEACHARNIRAPIYTTVQWDHYTAQRHPEWTCVAPDGGWASWQTPYEPGFYQFLCVNSPYRDFLKAHVHELLTMFAVDGLFFDILIPVDCSCRHCRTRMEEAGLDPADTHVRRRAGLQTLHNFMEDMTRFVRELNPECSVFYNSGHVGVNHRQVVNAFTHFEIESLPSGKWGYLHFPMVMRYVRTFGVDCVGMTGKFHTEWGDFHSFKHQAALEYECFRMVAMGAQCSIGDQLHPSGQIDPHTYSLIGSVYASVEQKEPWCQGARAVSEIGVLTVEEFVDMTVGNIPSELLHLPPAMMGATRILTEGAHQFDMLDSYSDFSAYKVLVLPDNIPVSDELADKLDTYLSGGGTLLASFESGMNAEKTGFTLKALGVTLTDDGPRDRYGERVRGRHFPHGDFVEYLLPTGAIGRGLAPTEHVMYMKGVDVEADAESEVLTEKIVSYFDRTYQHFCSHRQTPSSGRAGGPGIVQKGRTIYFAHPVFTQYSQNAPRWCKILVLNALDLLLPDPVIRHNGPSTLQIMLNEQDEPYRWVIHLLHYIPERRGYQFDVLEDVIPLYEVKISVKTSQAVKTVTCVPQQEVLPHNHRGGRVEFVVPKLHGHQMIVLEFA